MRTLTLPQLAALAPSTPVLCVFRGTYYATTDRAVAVSTILRGGSVRFPV